MSELPYDPANPPRDPPATVVRPMLWRVAVRLHTDHGAPSAVGAAAADAEAEAGLWCRLCGDPWPCFPRRLAERGLAAAFWR